jgi:hypothetical protein
MLQWALSRHDMMQLPPVHSRLQFVSLPPHRPSQYPPEQFELQVPLVTQVEQLPEMHTGEHNSGSQTSLPP